MGQVDAEVYIVWIFHLFHALFISRQCQLSFLLISEFIYTKQLSYLVSEAATSSETRSRIVGNILNKRKNKLQLLAS